MPIPALPALTAAARLLLAKGTREAVKKYGKGAVDKARNLINKRNKAKQKRETPLQGGKLPPERQGLPERYRDLDRPLPWAKTPEAQKVAQQHTADKAARAAESTKWQEGQRELKGAIDRSADLTAQRKAASLSQQAPKAVKKPTFQKGGKVRGAGIATQGVRPCKIV